MRYSTNDVDPIPGAGKLHALVSLPRDARGEGRPLTNPIAAGDALQDELEQLGEAARDHVFKAGLVGDPTAVLEAPKTAADVETILRKAKTSGARQVVFLRLLMASFAGYVPAWTYLVALLGGLPYIIVASIPVDRQSAYAAVEGHRR
jgi:hypothetical protein